MPMVRVSNGGTSEVRVSISWYGGGAIKGTQTVPCTVTIGNVQYTFNGSIWRVGGAEDYKYTQGSDTRTVILE